METIRAILVDDEESARDVLANLLARFCPGVDLLQKCHDVPAAVEAVKVHRPDLVFLDIEMPRYAGYEIVDFFDQVDFEIIFVSAYDKYAIKAFEVSAVDYLLKPVDIERLKESVARVMARRNPATGGRGLPHLKEVMQKGEFSTIVVPEKGVHHVIPLASIIAIEAHESYCTIHLADKKYMASRNLKQFETLLESKPEFFRVHKSWMVNLHHLLNYSKAEMEIYLNGDIVAKLSKYKKTEFEAAVKK